MNLILSRGFVSFNPSFCQMKHLVFFPGQINTRHIDDAVRILRDGGVIVYPTDTMYALGCDALNQKAIERLCRLKSINPEKQLLSIVCASLSQASEYARIDNHAFRTLKEYLPGPFTFVLPATSTLPKVFKGRKSVGVRIPDNDIARALAEALGNPIISSSVETADEEDAVNTESLVLEYQHDADLLLDGGEGINAVSTVVDLLDSSSPEILRQGIGEFDL